MAFVSYFCAQVLEKPPSCKLCSVYLAVLCCSKSISSLQEAPSEKAVRQRYQVNQGTSSSCHMQEFDRQHDPRKARALCDAVEGTGVSFKLEYTVVIDGMSLCSTCTGRIRRPVLRHIPKNVCTFSSDAQQNISGTWSTVVLHGETSKRLATPRNTKKKQETPTINPIGPTDKPHRPRTKHCRKDSLGDA